MKKVIKIASYRKYLLEWWFTEYDEIWELIEARFQYNKQYKNRIDENTRTSKRFN